MGHARGVGYPARERKVETRKQKVEKSINKPSLRGLQTGCWPKLGSYSKNRIFCSVLVSEIKKCHLLSEWQCHLLSCPGRIFSYCVRARAYTHVLARVYSTRASTCTIYTCSTLPHTRVNLTGLQLWGFQWARSFEIVEIVGIAASVFVIIGWVGQIQYQKPRSK